ncbi:hypothetical protein DGI_2506 [Megalodesulfovibrio gigas DSM 1382 = ATCC 19364]|uniref:Uncharacterized protein n=1 Tax=Megalodesulfovibrio gigas (strain ATCC 19364 / DSM 1382 / NCIMB 9332 / VKM B-1759) TaxID=1121448 RepID=T2GDJ3_MEGG1|nr:hypothetical protein DGI_2506 [Megalodesulfovibrio gigas DSM 1382 = ATCC 19364]
MQPFAEGHIEHMAHGTVPPRFIMQPNPLLVLYTNRGGHVSMEIGGRSRLFLDAGAGPQFS